MTGDRNRMIYHYTTYIIRCYTHCVLLFRENKALQFVEDSVLTGDSPNLGEVAVINGNPVSIGRSFPRGMSFGYDLKTHCVFSH
jgi:hypothetical protein